MIETAGEIKFRGKRLDNGEWVYGSLIVSKDACDTYTHIIVPQLGADAYLYADKLKPRLGVTHWYRVDPTTVGQLIDKRGETEVYIGDIVKWHREYEKTQLMYVECLAHSFFLVDADYVEVLGNVHDNPELLEWLEQERRRG